MAAPKGCRLEQWHPPRTSLVTPLTGAVLRRCQTEKVLTTKLTVDCDQDPLAVGSQDPVGRDAFVFSGLLPVDLCDLQVLPFTGESVYGGGSRGVVGEGSGPAVGRQTQTQTYTQEKHIRQHNSYQCLSDAGLPRTWAESTTQGCYVRLVCV